MRLTKIILIIVAIITMEVLRMTVIIIIIIIITTTTTTTKTLTNFRKQNKVPNINEFIIIIRMKMLMTTTLIIQGKPHRHLAMTTIK